MPPNQTDNQRLATALGSVLASVALLAGIALVGGFIWSRAALADKKDWLRTNGVAVTATLTEFDQGGSRSTDMIEIAYEYEGTRHEARIPCAGPTGCHATPEPTMQVQVDPRSPGEFLAANGRTDDSSSPRNAWTILVFGLVLLLVGVLLGTAMIVSVVQRRRRAAG